MNLSSVMGRVMDVGAMEQAADIKASEDVGIFGSLREKKYIKDKHMSSGSNPRVLPFPEPFQVATSVTGVPWNITNYACLVQFFGCNLECDYCFCGETIAKEVSVYDIYSNYWGEYVGNSNHYPTPVFRISGGEPFLQQEFLSALLRMMRRSKRVIPHFPSVDSLYFWVDTNLTVEPEEYLMDSLSYENVGVCGCFKPVSAPDYYESQCRHANMLIEAGVDMYFYYPCALTDTEKRETLATSVHSMVHGNASRWVEEFEQHLDETSRSIGKFYACRTHPIAIGYHYGAVGGNPEFSSASLFKQKFLINTLREYILDNLGEIYYWLPDYQVDIVNGCSA